MNNPFVHFGMGVGGMTGSQQPRLTPPTPPSVNLKQPGLRMPNAFMVDPMTGLLPDLFGVQPGVKRRMG